MASIQTDGGRQAPSQLSSAICLRNLMIIGLDVLKILSGNYFVLKLTETSTFDQVTLITIGLTCRPKAMCLWSLRNIGQAFIMILNRNCFVYKVTMTLTFNLKINMIYPYWYEVLGLYLIVLYFKSYMQLQLEFSTLTEHFALPLYEES